MLRLRELNNERIIFEAMIRRIGGVDARRVFARAINHEMARANTAVKREIRSETGIKVGDISKAIRLKRATSGSNATLTAAIIANGKAFPLKYFGARQFSYGVRARPWNRSQRFEHAFIVPSLQGGVFVRATDARLPIKELWGPSVPNEMTRDKVIAVFGRATDKIADRAVHELHWLMNRRG